MSKKKRNFLISLVLILLSLVFTILVKTIDVKPVGVNETSIGFATINQFIFNFFGVNMIWYHITDWLGLIPVFLSIGYTFIGIYQLLKRKKLLKVDKEIILLGLFYIVVISLYLFFEKVIINYRPIMINSVLEASYPSSHTLMTLFLCASSILINKKLFNNKFTNIINILSLLIIIITIIGRLISGVHWFTDIVGGIFIASALLMSLYSFLEIIKK